MKQIATFVVAAVVILLVVPLAFGQQAKPAGPGTASAVPRLVRFSGVVKDDNGHSRSGVVGITFSLYQDQEGGAALWLETQNVQADSAGHYTVLLGESNPHGLPMELFASGEARWLGMQPAGQPEGPRVLLLSVPYALKAADAETIGGLPPSAFVLAAPQVGSITATASKVAATTATAAPPPASSNVTTTGGTVNTIPLFTTASNIQNSILTQTGTTTVNVGGKLNLPATGTATSAGGKNSQALNLATSAFKSGTGGGAVNQNFLWQAEPAGNNSSTPSGTLNLLFGAGAAAPTETGLRIANSGLINFSRGQTFPGAGTITGVTAGSGMTGGGSSGNVSLSLASNACASGNALTALPFRCSPFATLGANTFTGSQTVNGNVSATGLVTGSAFNIGSQLFAFGSGALQNAFLGFAGNTTATGGGNTATGDGALSSDTSGFYNTATGDGALSSDTTGSTNTASGYLALQFNTTGGNNTASGVLALQSNTKGNNNTATGSQALFRNTGDALGNGSYNTATGLFALANNTLGSGNTAVGSSAGNTTNNTNTTGSNNTFVGANSSPGTQTTLSNATAIGYRAEVDASNAMVLGSINGVNGATASTNVGIGTTAPRSALEVAANVPGGLGPNVTFTNNGGGGQVSLDFNSYVPSTTGTYNPSARIIVRDVGNWTDDIHFQANTPGSANNKLRDIFSIDAAGNVTIPGNANIIGSLSKGSGSFKIDDPLDPANKYLYHSFVESPDMMNVYNGNIVTDKHGLATVVMPDYFEALNRDFRYQLTVIGQFAQAVVAQKIANNRFLIRTSKPRVEVSWLVTGIRQDAYANAYRIPTEEEKPPREQGRYLHPELFGASGEQAIGYRPSSQSAAVARAPLTSVAP